MPAGKAIAQGAHASVRAALISMSKSGSTYREWMQSGETKIVLAVKSETELARVLEKAKDAGLTTSLIQDEGRTVFTEPTFTAGAIGPADGKEIDKVTKRLRLY